MTRSERQVAHGDDGHASRWARVFLAHPRAAGQGYFEHLRFAWSVSRSLFGAALAAFVHGAVPVFYETRAGDTIRRLHREVDRGTSSGDTGSGLDLRG